MPADRWKSLGTTELQSANKKAQEFIREKEREAAGIIEPKLARDAAQCPLVQHLNDSLCRLSRIALHLGDIHAEAWHLR